MGIEIVFILILPIAVLCLPAAVLFWSRVGLLAITGWLALSLVGWAISAPSYSFPSFLASMAIRVLLYGLPIPLAALWLLRPAAEPKPY